MPLDPLFHVIGEILAAVHDAHVVDEAHVATLHGGTDFVLACDEMAGIERFGLGFGQAGDAGRAAFAWVAGQETAGEVEDYFVVGSVVEEGAGVERRSAAVTV